MKPKNILTFLIFILTFVVSCTPIFLKFQGFRPSETREEWDLEVWEGLLQQIKGKKGEVFSALEDLIKEKMKSPVIFACDVKGRAGDEIFLMLPRNTKIRPSTWDGRFIWKETKEGTNYVFHLYADGKEVLKKPQENNKRTRISDEEIDLVSNVEYTWDITTCVEICNLSLAASAFNRPSFIVMTDDEEGEVSEWLSFIEGWCGENKITSSETKVALSALVLEHFGLYMEEEELIKGELKDHPDSVMLHLILSGCLDVMGRSREAEEEYLKALGLSITE